MYVFGVAGLEGKLFCQLFLSREGECTPLPLTSFPLMGNGGACAYGQIADALCVGLLMFVNAFMCVSVEFKEYWDHYKNGKLFGCYGSNTKTWKNGNRLPLVLY